MVYLRFKYTLTLLPLLNDTALDIDQCLPESNLLIILKAAERDRVAGQTRWRDCARMLLVCWASRVVGVFSRRPIVV